MADVFVSIGSNINRDHNIRGGLNALREHFGEITLSPVYESLSVGFDGENFYNLAASFQTNLTIDELGELFDQIEDAYGRDRNSPRFSARTLDIDLLLYDRVVSKNHCILPRPEIYENAFVLKPLADIAGNLTDPLKDKTYQQLWREFQGGEKQELWEINIDLNP
ncbi:MAG: 2-amino-4-hydroxy-6-hydroxymethyldihydropteridine diphosphokinase [Gammaproteobacteria bacterium]|nr:2-amino-4-hydroxy-6-hydroxymethyldihydropteridine diphosphokinase [Gammaproteobacteria bacterium]